MIRNMVAMMVGVFVLGGCSEPAQDKEDVPQQVQVQQEAPQGVDLDFGDSVITPAVAQGGKGTVMAAQDVEAYTYLDVQNASSARFWIASNSVKVAAGDVISWGQGSVMNNFHSKALNRDFKEILFVSSVLPANQQPADNNTAPAANSGRVVSTQQAGGYSFILVDAGGKQSWLAAPATEISEGDTVSWNGGSVMNNFHSSSLDRDFESILFVGGVSVTR